MLHVARLPFQPPSIRLPLITLLAPNSTMMSPAPFPVSAITLLAMITPEELSWMYASPACEVPGPVACDEIGREHDLLRAVHKRRVELLRVDEQRVVRNGDI